MNLSAKYPNQVIEKFKKLEPYQNYMNATLIENGYKPSKFLDATIFRFYSAFEDYGFEGAEGGFFKDIWEKVRSAGRSIGDFSKSAYNAPGDFLKSLLAGVDETVKTTFGNLFGGITGGGSNDNSDPENKDNTMLYLGLGVAAIGLVYYLKTRK